MNYFFATSNPGKLREVNAIFAGEGIEVKPLPDFGSPFAAEENGETFAENATAKAVQALEWLRENGIGDAVVLADDSGLCVDAMAGQPGVYSARFLGENTPYSVKNNQILNLISGVPDEKRTARFECVIACAFPDGRVLTADGKVEGVIAREPMGEGGFGYDPIFFVPEYGKTTAQLPFELKNSISHRGGALRKMCELLRSK